MNNKYYALNNDYLFKKVMGKEVICREFLKSIFNIELGEFSYGNREFIKENKNLSYGISDIVLHTEKGPVVIELQNRDNHNIETRVMMYLSKLYVEQWKNHNYNGVKPVSLYLILNYPYGNVFEEYQMLETKIHKQFGNNFYVKIWNLQEKQKEEIKKLYQRLFFIKTNEELEVLRDDTRIQRIVEEIQEYNESEEERQKMKRSEDMYWTDEEIVKFHEVTLRDWWKEVGMKEGIEEGLKEGKEEGLKIGKEEGIRVGKEEGMRVGKEEGKIEMLKNMIAENLDINTIMKITKLSKSEIEKYQNQLSNVN